MTAYPDSTAISTYVAIDIAKKWNTVLMEGPDGGRRSFRMANSREEYDRFIGFLRSQSGPCRIAMEPTGTYHRPLAHRLSAEGFEVYLISSVAASRIRDAMFNSWDKNDPKDAQVLLELLKRGHVLRYYDPLEAGIHDIQELSQTYLRSTSDFYNNAKPALAACTYAPAGFRFPRTPTFRL